MTSISHNIVKVMPNMHGYVSANEDEAVRRKDQLMRQCMDRYLELLRRNHTALNKETLFIIDLDETLLDQREMNRNPISEDSDQQEIENAHAQLSELFNVPDLVFGVRHSRNAQYLAVFRPFVMDFIHTFHDSADLVVYTQSDPEFSIPPLILVEMYFNLMHGHQSEADTGTFQFAALIYRDPFQKRAIVAKSLSAVSAVIGPGAEMNRYHRIFIVDDMADRTWTNTIPGELVDTKCIIHAVQASQFLIQTGAQPCTFYDMALKASETRQTDEFWKELKQFVLVADMGYAFGRQRGQTTLQWTSHSDMIALIDNHTLGGKHSSTCFPCVIV